MSHTYVFYVDQHYKEIVLDTFLEVKSMSLVEKGQNPARLLENMKKLLLDNPLPEKYQELDKLVPKEVDQLKAMDMRGRIHGSKGPYSVRSECELDRDDLSMLLDCKCNDGTIEEFLKDCKL